MPVLGVTKRRLRRGLGGAAAVAACGSGAAAVAACGSAAALPALAAGGPTVQAARQCYVVGQRVQLSGTGFAPSRGYVVSIDDVYFGQQQTDSSGAFTTGLRPGGLAAGIAQAVEHVGASDGSSSATTTFTMTRATGATFLTSGGGSQRLPLEAWGFSMSGGRVPLYLHYLSPGGSLRRTVRVGRTTGACGFLRTAPRAIFPFSPGRGSWTLQLDTRRRYKQHPGKPVARIRVRIS